MSKKLSTSKWTALAAVAIVSASVGASHPAAAFELESPAGTCKGHEWLTTAAASAVGIDKRYLPSMELGARYVDLGGMTFAKDWFFGDMKILVHRGPGSTHNHFCLRGGAGDLRALIKDAAARIREVLLLALKQPASKQETIVDGGMVTASDKRVYLRYFLLGAALHTLQDSFAHGHRTPVWGRLPRHYRPRTMLSKWGGTNGKAFRSKGYYTRIVKAVLVPKPARGTAKHNEVYSAGEGGPRKSDKIWNAALCQVATKVPGNLMPHAFAAYLASRDFLAIYRSAARQRRYRNRARVASRLLTRFMKHWFRDAKGRFPGFGKPHGKCQGKSVTRCPRLLLPGETGYVKPKPSGVGDAIAAGARFVGRKVASGAKKAVNKVRSWSRRAWNKIRSKAKKARRKIKSRAKKAVRSVRSRAKKVGNAVKRGLKKLKFW